MSNIVWIASYPKSGNTWFRTVLANFLANAETPVDINNMDGLVASDRRAADETLGVECSDLTFEEIDRYRPAIYRSIARQSPATLYMKVHDAFSWNSHNEALFPADVTVAVIYLVRNPLDVAVSFARHTNRPIDEVITQMSQSSTTLAGRRDRLSLQLPQHLGSWSRHVKSWLEKPMTPVHLMRYEDAWTNPVEAFAGAFRSIGLEPETTRLQRAIEFSNIDNLRRQEAQGGFREKLLGAEPFFGKGGVRWRETLNEKQIENVLREHRPVMSRLGYLTEADC